VITERVPKVDQHTWPYPAASDMIGAAPATGSQDAFAFWPSRSERPIAVCPPALTTQ